ERMGQGGAAYNICVPMQLRGPLRVAALEQALDEIVRRHEVLRTTFAEGESGPVQVIAPATGFELAVEPVAGADGAARRAEARRLAREDTTTPFDLARGPLFRARLLQVAADEHVLLLGVHHAVSDGWSMGVLFRELAVLYGAFSTGAAS